MSLWTKSCHMYHIANFQNKLTTKSKEKIYFVIFHFHGCLFILNLIRMTLLFFCKKIKVVKNVLLSNGLQKMNVDIIVLIESALK